MIDLNEVNHSYLRYNNVFNEPDHHLYSEEAITKGCNEKYTTMDNWETLSPPPSPPLSPIGSDFTKDINDHDETNQCLQNELFVKSKQIENLKNKLEHVSKSYSDENLRQLSEMNRLIAIILDEKHQIIARFEKQIKGQQDKIHLLSQKLSAKDLLIEKMNEENASLRKQVKFHANSTRSTIENKGHTPIKVNNTICDKEERCHHPNARRVSPVENWRKHYVTDSVEKDGRIWYWCNKHKMPDYDGLYVTHHPDEHDKWAEKVAETKRHKTMKKNKNLALSSQNTFINAVSG